MKAPKICDGFYVQKKRCDQCLFTNDRIVSSERAKRILEKAAKTGNFFVCHKQDLDKDWKNSPVRLCCRGFWDANKFTNQNLLLAQAIETAGVQEVQFVKVEGEIFDD